MLDVPNFFWESEPTLYPLYIAVREYLEIKPRIQVLNERCRVFLDLAEILSDSIADNRTSRTWHLTHTLTLSPTPNPFNNNNMLTLLMSDQTWIIIVLILISIIVTISEVFLRFGLLHAREGASANPASVLARLMGRSVPVSAAAPSGWASSYATAAGGSVPPGCVCPSLAPADAGAGAGLGISGIRGL